MDNVVGKDESRFDLHSFKCFAHAYGIAEDQQDALIRHSNGAVARRDGPAEGYPLHSLFDALSWREIRALLSDLRMSGNVQLESARKVRSTYVLISTESQESMNPNSYLRSFWRAEVTDTVFVAMSFEKRFDARFEEVIKPAIEDKPLGGLRLKANRVDNSRTGDSILTEIVDGIAHARVILADVSVVDEGRLTEVSVRNGNVMYEVGIALASRTPAEVLLVRDDDKKLLFDTSSIPHHRIPFENASAAIQELRSALEDRLREADLLRDARVRQMARSLTEAEFRLLQDLSKLAPNEASEVGTWVGNGRVMNLNVDRGVARLLDKGCIASSSFDEDGMAYYRLTPFGRLVVQATKRHVDSPEAVADGNSSPIVQESNTHPDGPN